MISPLAYVDSKAVIGNNVTIHPFAYIDKDVVIGDNCVIYPYASVLAGTVMGKNNLRGIATPEGVKYTDEFFEENR